MNRKATDSIFTVIGIDIGKNAFHLVGLDERGAIVIRQKLSRGQVTARLANMPPCLIGMEACVGAHHAKAVGAVFGLTSSQHQSGESNRTGGISRCGNEMMRAVLYEAAQILLVRSTRWSWLKAWAMQIARRRGMKKAIVALGRRLAVIMHRSWVDGTEFRWTRDAVAT